MIIGSLLISLAILIVVVIVITRPLYTADDEEAEVFPQADNRLNADYQQVLVRIRELEQAHLETKMDEDDYQGRREELFREAAELLRVLDSSKSENEMNHIDDTG